METVAGNRPSFAQRGGPDNTNTCEPCAHCRVARPCVIVSHLRDRMAPLFLIASIYKRKWYEIIGSKIVPSS